MTKIELLKEWQEKTEKDIPSGLSMVKHDTLLNCLCKVIAEELAAGGEVPLPHIGKLQVRDVAARTGRNPKTGEKVQVAAKYVPHFKAGKEMRERIDLSGTKPPVKLAA